MMTNNARGTLSHAPQRQLAIAGDNLLIAGRPVAELALEAGDRPFYAYDRNAISKQVSDLRAALPERVMLHYAVKANPFPPLVRHLAGLCDGLDIASGGELRGAIDCGVPATDISFAGPGKSSAELEAAVAAGVLVIAESGGELRRLDALARATGRIPPVAVRVNPDFELKLSGLRMGGGAKPFGIDAEQVPQVLRELAGMALDFRGFHIYCGGQSLRADALIEAQNQTFALAFRLARQSPMPVRWLNIGGGFGVPYFPGEQALELPPVMDNLGRLVEDCAGELPSASVVMELGRYLVAGAGVYICRIVDRKVSRGRTYLVTNGGLNHHLAATGNFGQVIRKNYPVAIANRMQQPATEVVSIVGPLCTPLDLLADQVTLPRADVGDLVAVFQSGAYGLSASPHNFLGHPPAAELMP